MAQAHFAVRQLNNTCKSPFLSSLSNTSRMYLQFHNRNFDLLINEKIFQCRKNLAVCSCIRRRFLHQPSLRLNSWDDNRYKKS